MGAINEEELTRWEKIHGVVGGREEKILVLVRLRPLSEKEIARDEVSDWECINNITILYRNSLQERSGLPTAYTFDRVFRGDSPTREVYDEGAKEIALSVVSGFNSTIFAYGQTSSGKTYTMNGITEYAVADIYDYIERHEERAFVMKFSAIEIYNEVVRDLLGTDNTPLRILDDPEKGTIVENLTEETLRDWNHLKGLLSICEAQRRIGETSLNETSSRSHQILRLTIESSAREFLGKDNSTTLAASVNFVDLAGSERASQASSIGQRLKEGCHINRSLLTLGTVIRKLSKGRNGHVNYRDSKLTRILQPSLGGNARTAIICTLSPARSHVEQSRNTLLFASCAKEVSTNAQVNVVMSDKALVKHLQKELARLEGELKTPVPTPDYAALLRRKDQQIEKLEKEVRELTKQRDLAQSRVEDLLQAVGSDRTLEQMDGHTHHPKWEKENDWEDESLVSRSSVGIDPHYLDVSVGKSSLAPFSNRDNRSNDGTSLFSSGSKFSSTDPCQSKEEFSSQTGEDSDETCKEVRCIEMDESGKGETTPEPIGRMSALISSSNGVGANQEFPSTPPAEDSHIHNGFSYGEREQRLLDVHKTIESMVSPYPDEEIMSSSRNPKLYRSHSCRADLMTGSSSPDYGKMKQSENTPPDEYENNFPGRPDRAQRKHWKLPPLNYGVGTPRLSGNDNSVQSPISIAASGDDDIPSVHTFVAGLKEMAQLQYEKQLLDDQVREMEATAGKSEKNVRDVGLDPMHESSGTLSDWPAEYERLLNLILELWQTCNVSLIHRTYFFLLFKGDLSDSIYMEVELRRLSFLKDTFSNGHSASQDGRTLTLDSSNKCLRRERLMLTRLMHKRFSEQERNRIYQNWGIHLDSKRRRFELISRLWTNTTDKNHVKESANIVAKLIKFSEKGQALEEMFGLSFTPPRLTRRSFGWRNSMKSLL